MEKTKTSFDFLWASFIEHLISEFLFYWPVFHTYIHTHTYLHTHVVIVDTCRCIQLHSINRKPSQSKEKKNKEMIAKRRTFDDDIFIDIYIYSSWDHTIERSYCVRASRLRLWCTGAHVNCNKKMKIKYIYLWIEQQHHVHWRRHWTPVLSEWLRMHTEYTIYPEEEKEKRRRRKTTADGRQPTATPE